MNDHFFPYETIHATALVIGECGILIRGKSGAGKSSLALSMISEAKNSHLFARLVSDDRVRLFATHSHLIALVHPSIEGLIEVRQIGIINLDYEKSCVVRLVIDLEDNPPRMIAIEDETVEILGVKLLYLKLKRNELLTNSILVFLKNSGFA